MDVRDSRAVGDFVGRVEVAAGRIDVLVNTAGGVSGPVMLPGLIFALISGLLMSFGIAAVSRDNNFPQIARLVILFSLGVTIWAFMNASLALFLLPVLPAAAAATLLSPFAIAACRDAIVLH